MINWNDYPNFSEAEFACKCGKCGGRADMHPDFMEKLQSLRDVAGPLHITSGFRCPEHPTEKRKPKPGAHSIGRAADIATGNTVERARIVSSWSSMPVYGMGIAKTFTHVDDHHPYLSRVGGVIWVYGS